MVSGLFGQWGEWAGGWWGGLRETEKPKVSGWSLNRRVRMVDLPVPEGPDITIGRRGWGAGLLEGGIAGISGVRGKYLSAPLRNSCGRRDGPERQEARRGAATLSTR